MGTVRRVHVPGSREEKRFGTSTHLYVRYIDVQNNNCDTLLAASIRPWPQSIHDELGEAGHPIIPRVLDSPVADAEHGSRSPSPIAGTVTSKVSATAKLQDEQKDHSKFISTAHTIHWLRSGTGESGSDGSIDDPLTGLLETARETNEEYPFAAVLKVMSYDLSTIPFEDIGTPEDFFEEIFAFDRSVSFFSTPT
jgi:hypothetical protein